MDQQPLPLAADAGRLPASFPTPEPSRHDAFTGEQMACFCEVLAETGMVTAAARAAGKNRDTVYQHRRRNPLFAAAWAGALSHARTRLADALLERSLNGSIDYIYRDGELVGERRYYDNRLAYSMLRRLDREAEAEPPAVTAALADPSPRAPTKADYRTALKALRTGSEEDLCAALAIFKPFETDKTDNPPLAEADPVGVDDRPFGSDRVWVEEGEWWTNFPPPPGFDREERGSWEEEDYQRECTAEESALLMAGREAELAGYRAEEEAERDAFWNRIRTELVGTTGEEEEPMADDGDAAAEIDAKIAALPGWKGETLARVRRLIHEAHPEVVEEIKWRKPSNPAGVAVWSHAGIICTGEPYKDKVKLTFAKGAALPDPDRVFNASLEAGTTRALDLREGDPLDEEAFKAIIRAAAAANERARAAK